MLSSSADEIPRVAKLLPGDAFSKSNMKSSENRLPTFADTFTCHGIQARAFRRQQLRPSAAPLE
jgi:hypothetical protein